MSLRGGPGTDDPGRAVFDNLDLANLVTLALGTDFNHLSAPGWMRSQRFVIEAKIPEGATRKEFVAMLRNLLIERFHLTYHNEKKEATVYDLVLAKNEPKFKEAAPASGPPAAPLSASQPQVDPEGYPVLPGGRGMRFMNGRARIRLDETMDNLADLVSGQIGSPVTNATGLAGKYDIALQWVSEGLKTAAADNDPGPSIFDALQEQLGLKLQPKKGAIEMFVIDHIDKTPTEN